MKSECQRLVEFSNMVRESTLKRLKAVPHGKENWCICPESLSFSDIAQHLIDVDDWLFHLLISKKKIRAEAKPRMKTVNNREEFEQLISKLGESQIQRRKLIFGLPEEILEHEVEDPFLGKMSTWWAVMRGNIDHEIHHRGQLAVYLKMASQD